LLLSFKKEGLSSLPGEDIGAGGGGQAEKGGGLRAGPGCGELRRAAGRGKRATAIYYQKVNRVAWRMQTGLCHQSAAGGAIMIFS
jgi:hypothetical protein